MFSMLTCSIQLIDSDCCIYGALTVKRLHLMICIVKFRVWASCRIFYFPHQMRFNDMFIFLLHSCVYLRFLYLRNYLIVKSTLILHVLFEQINLSLQCWYLCRLSFSNNVCWLEQNNRHSITINVGSLSVIGTVHYMNAQQLSISGIE